MLQRRGSYEIRGPMDKFVPLTAEQKAPGVICSSAGNHAQGVALGLYRGTHRHRMRVYDAGRDPDPHRTS
jgi:threonine dehydratase